MKVEILLSTLGVGGLSRSISGLEEGLLRNGHVVAVPVRQSQTNHQD